jgi:hypothetical protein
MRGLEVEILNADDKKIHLLRLRIFRDENDD